MDDTAFSVAQARSAGVPLHRLRRGDMQAPFFGVRNTAGGELDLWQRCRSYAQWMRDDAFFCGLTAALLHGIPTPPQLIDQRLHVAVPPPHRAPRSKGILGRQATVDACDLTEMDGLPVTTAARTWCDLASILSLDDLVAAGDSIARTAGGDLVGAVERYPIRRDLRKISTALAFVDGRSESAPESRLRLGLMRAGVHGLVPNYEVVIGGARFRLDLAIPKAKIAIEYQGDYHRDRGQWLRDLTRRRTLEADDWYVIEVGSNDLRPLELSRLAAQVQSRAASRDKWG